MEIINKKERQMQLRLGLLAVKWKTDINLFCNLMAVSY